MIRVILNLRNAAKGKEPKGDDESIFTGSRHGVSVRADDMQQPLEVVVLLKDIKDKDRIVGIEVNGYVMPYHINFASAVVIDAAQVPNSTGLAEWQTTTTDAVSVSAGPVHI